MLDQMTATPTYMWGPRWLSNNLTEIRKAKNNLITFDIYTYNIYNDIIQVEGQANKRFQLLEEQI